jgi:hypothetical protein
MAKMKERFIKNKRRTEVACLVFFEREASVPCCAVGAAVRITTYNKLLVTRYRNDRKWLELHQEAWMIWPALLAPNPVSRFFRGQDGPEQLVALITPLLQGTIALSIQQVSGTSKQPWQEPGKAVVRTQQQHGHGD